MNVDMLGLRRLSRAMSLTWKTPHAGTTAFGTTPAAGCNPDWSAWTLGSRTQWEPLRGLIMGVDVIYQRLESARPDGTGLVTVLAATNGLTAGTYAVRDQDAWSGTFRIQRDFLP